MKTHFPAPLCVALIGVAAFALSPLCLFGQAPSPASTDAKGVVHIPAGRLQDVLKFLNEKFPAGKFTATPDVLFLQVDDILVGGANGAGPTLNDVANAVERASLPLAVSGPVDPSHPVFTFQKNLLIAADVNAVNAVEAFNLEDTVAAGSDQDKLQSARYHQADLVKNLVSGAINTIREEGRVPINGEPRFQFNSNANVLIAIGNSDVLGITRKIVDAVNAAARSGMTANKTGNAAPAGKPAPNAPSPSSSH